MAMIKEGVFKGRPIPLCSLSPVSIPKVQDTTDPFDIKADYDNGIYDGSKTLEDLLPGFLTESVSGREGYSKEISETSIGKRYGATYNYAQGETRDLKIKFSIATEQNNYTALCDKLKSILMNTYQSDYPQLGLIFTDDPSCYYLGTTSSIEISQLNTAGSDYTSAKGTITFHCSDPYKHATVPKAVTVTTTESGATGASFKTFTTNYTYSQNDIDAYSASGYSGTWNVNESTSELRVGDTVRLRCTNSSKSGYCFIIAKVTAIPDDKSITCTSSGLNDHVIEMTLENKGNVPTPVSIETTFASETGYIGFSLCNTYYQVGNPQEQDRETRQKSVQVFDNHMNEQHDWVLNDGAVFPPQHGSDGTAGIGWADANGSCRFIWDQGVIDSNGLKEGYVEPTGYGSGSFWHGIAMTKTLPAIEGQYPYNWSCQWRFDFNEDTNWDKRHWNGQGVGHNSMTFSDANGAVICSIGFEDTTDASINSNMFITIGNKRVFDERFKGTAYYVSITKNMKRDAGSVVCVDKYGSYINIRFRDVNVTYALSNLNQLRKITWYGAALKSYLPMANNNFRAMNFTMHNVNYVVDVPNYFQRGYTLYIDGENDKNYVNGALNWDRVDVASRPLMLLPGKHTLRIAVSSFATTLPTVKATYRERWN